MSGSILENYAIQVYFLHCWVLSADFLLVGMEAVIWELYYVKLCDCFGCIADCNPWFFKSHLYRWGNLWMAGIG